MTLPEEPPEYELVYPFVVCQTNGNPYDDQAFTAGVQIGRLDHALAAGAAVGVRTMDFTIFDDLVPQVELVAMHRGFLHIRHRHTGVEGWAFVEVSVEPFTDSDTQVDQ